MTLPIGAVYSVQGVTPLRGISWAAARNDGLIGTDAAGWVYRVRLEGDMWVAERLGVLRTTLVGRYRFRVMAAGAADSHSRGAWWLR